MTEFTNAVSSSIANLRSDHSKIIDFLLSAGDVTATSVPGDRQISDFLAGNPQEMPIPGFAEALARWAEPKSADWYAYTLSKPSAQKAAAASLQERYGLPFRSEDVLMTTGAFGGLAVAMRILLDPGDEVIFFTPPWFFYEAMIGGFGGQSVKLTLSPPDFDLDLDAVAKAITPRTRAVLLNSPHNPTGRIFPDDAVKQLAAVLEDASQKHGRPVWLISDEAYSKILYSGSRFVSPTTFYEHSLLIYTYGKTLLTPGQRLGYIALPPSLPEADQVREAILMAQLALGWAMPSALMQYALPDLEKLSIDMSVLEKRRDRLVEGLASFGYEVSTPEATFYLLPKSPIDDDVAFTKMLTEEEIYVLPGSLVELPGYFRISVTASDEMIDRALPGFDRAMEKARSAS